MNEVIYSMFDDYSQVFKKRWGNIFHSGRAVIEKALQEEAARNGCTIRRSGRDYLWINRKGAAEALFRFIADSTDISLFQDIYQKIKQKSVPVAFIVVHQTVDGEGNYDVFRISERSYLENNNRPRYRK